jgi:hypothetical protein
MNSPAITSAYLNKISHHGFCTLYENKSTGEKSLHAAMALKSGTVFATFEAAKIINHSTKFTVQVDEHTHVILSPDALTYLNHSCNPNVFLNTTTFEIIALRNIKKQEEITFFYPSTEWQMDAPFNCFCGSDNCLHTIQGASFLSLESIARYRFTDFILEKLNNSHLQIV